MLKFPKNLILLAVIIIVIAIPIAWYLISPLFIVKEANDSFPNTTLEKEMERMEGEVVEMDDLMPLQPVIRYNGTFKSSAHDVTGNASVIETGSSRVLRFENFETLNGPDLHIYLSKDLEATDYVDIGKIKATKGNVNYDLPPTISLDEYKYVLIWCEPFRVLFGSAEILKI